MQTDLWNASEADLEFSKESEWREIDDEYLNPNEEDDLINFVGV